MRFSTFFPITTARTGILLLAIELSTIGRHAAAQLTCTRLFGNKVPFRAADSFCMAVKSDNGSSPLTEFYLQELVPLCEKTCVELQENFTSTSEGKDELLRYYPDCCTDFMPSCTLCSGTDQLGLESPGTLTALRFGRLSFLKARCDDLSTFLHLTYLEFAESGHQCVDFVASGEDPTRPEHDLMESFAELEERRRCRCIYESQEPSMSPLPTHSTLPTSLPSVSEVPTRSLAPTVTATPTERPSDTRSRVSPPSNDLYAYCVLIALVLAIVGCLCYCWNRGPIGVCQDICSWANANAPQETRSERTRREFLEDEADSATRRDNLTPRYYF